MIQIFEHSPISVQVRKIDQKPSSTNDENFRIKRQIVVIENYQIWNFFIIYLLYIYMKPIRKAPKL